MRRTGELLAAAALVAVLAACVTGAAGPGAGTAAAEPPEQEYPGMGRDPSLLGAMNRAKMDAVQRAVIDLVGEEAERSSREALERGLYGTSDPNAYVVAASFSAKRTERVEGEYVVEATVLVRRDVVAARLKALGVSAGAAAAPARSPAAAPEGPTPEEARFIQDYVAHMSWMVYFAEKTGVDPFYMKAAVGIANEYLASRTMEAVDLEQVERLKRDQQKAWEAETGRSIGIVQWIAQKLNADVYIEIDGVLASEKATGRYYGQANVTLKAFESSTGRLLGSGQWNSPRTLSTVSEQAAVINAVEASVSKTMPGVVDQAGAYMAKALAGGIRYELVLQRTTDPEVVGKFIERLKSRVVRLQTLSQADEESRYELYLFGTADDLVAIVAQAARAVPGLEGMKRVIVRGRNVTFATGL